MSPREELLLKVTYRNGQSLPAFGRNFLSALSLLAFHLMCPFSMPQWNSGAGVHFVRMPLSPPPIFFAPFSQFSQPQAASADRWNACLIHERYLFFLVAYHYALRRFSSISEGNQKCCKLAGASEASLILKTSLSTVKYKK